MRRSQTLPAFTPSEYRKAHELLATRVAFMMGRKFEEDDWAHVYCTAKNIPRRGWSNLNIDVIHNGLGVEHKMLRPAGDKPVREVFGLRLMHPSATRSIRISDGRPDEVMRNVLDQYARFLKQRRDHVKQNCPDHRPDMRTGWVLWQSNLKEFVYFEEEALIPNPRDYIAEWHENKDKGSRKRSKSLWIYEKATGQKKFSVTTAAGAKIQPYFDVPPESDPNVYIFTVQGEEFKPGLIRVWVAASTARELDRLAGDLNADNLQRVIAKSISQVAAIEPMQSSVTEDARSLLITIESYALLMSTFPNAVSDAHRIQLLAELLGRQR